MLMSASLKLGCCAWWMRGAAWQAGEGGSEGLKPKDVQIPAITNN